MKDRVEIVLDYDGTPKAECTSCFIYSLIHLPMDSRALIRFVRAFRREHRRCRR